MVKKPSAELNSYNKLVMKLNKNFSENKKLAQNVLVDRLKTVGPSPHKLIEHNVEIVR